MMVVMTVVNIGATITTITTAIADVAISSAIMRFDGGHQSGRCDA